MSDDGTAIRGERSLASAGFEIGTQVGSYRIDARLGEGGMGVVYRATDTKLNRPVAIKFLADDLFDANARRRFQREAQMASSLNHPHILTVYDVGEHADRQYLVTELVDGGTLQDWARAESHRWRQVVELMIGVADALAVAHDASILHRDVKPANILISKSGYAKLADFGLAKLVEESDSARPRAAHHTATGVVVGTAAYMSPEQALGRSLDARSDIFTFGVVLYELLAGRHPFAGETDIVMLQSVIHAAPPSLPDEIPEALKTVVEKALEKEPADRYQSMRDLVVDLRRIARKSSAERSPVARGARRPRVWIPWSVAALAIAAILGLVASALLREPNAVPARVAVVRFGVPIPDGVAADTMSALSPDGRNLAISGAEDGKLRLWVRALDESEPRRLAGGDGAQFPFWSPDGKQIGFFADGKLKTILASGGEPATIADAGPTLFGGAWGRDGAIVFAQVRQLFKVSEKGGTPELLYKPESGILFDPAFLPDGRHFLFVNNTSGVYVGSLDAMPPARILPDASRTVFAPDGYLLFTRESRLMAQPFDTKLLALTGEALPVTREPVVNELLAPMLSAGAGGVLAYRARIPQQLLWVDRTGAPKEKIGPPQDWYNFRLSPDQTRLAFDFSPTGGAESSYDVALFDMRRATRERLTSGGKGALVPVFAPDGKQIAFSSNRMGRFNPYITDAPDQERLVKDMELGGGFPVDWSPDGKNLLWWGNEELWAVPVDGGKPDTLLKSRFSQNAGAFSPDGRWIAYSSNESGRYEIYLTTFPAEGGRRYAVSSQGGASPAWRRDGKELFYVAGDGRLTAVPVTIRGGDVQFGGAESLFFVSPSRFSRAYEPSLDGQRFLVTAPAAVPGAAAITIVLNWPLLLGR